MFDRFIKLFRKGQESIEPTFTSLQSTPKAVIDDSAYSSLMRLIDRANNLKPLSVEQRKRIFRSKIPDVASKMLNDGATYGVASERFDFLNQNQDAAKSHIKKIDNDLSALLQIVEQEYERLHDRGEIPAPHYPWRIAVILSREKQKELELLFLASWCKQVAHLDFVGRRYKDLIARHHKLSASTPTKANK